MMTLSCNRVCLVQSGASVVHTKRSGALLSVHLAFALLAHFVNFATCALPKCASRMQNPTFAPYLHTSFSVFKSYLSLLQSFLLPVIAASRPPNLRHAMQIERPVGGYSRSSPVFLQATVQPILYGGQVHIQQGRGSLQWLRHAGFSNAVFYAAYIRSRKQDDTDGTSNIVLPCPGSQVIFHPL